MSIWFNLPLSNLERRLGQLLMKYRELGLEGRAEEKAEVATMMKDIGMAIEAQKSKPPTALPTAFQTYSARPPKRESDYRAFKKYGSCKRGNRCWWKHDPQYRDKKKAANQRQEVPPEVRQSLQ